MRDVERSFAFYVDVLGLRAVARWDGGAYLAAGGDWITPILNPVAREGPLPGYTHLAFSVSSFERVSGRLAEVGVRIWQDDPTEGDSLYFLDPDGHELEIHASHLAKRLDSDRNNPPPGKPSHKVRDP